MVTPTLKNKIRLPAEWEPQSAVLVAWPPENDYWRPILADVRKSFVAMIEAIVEDQIVILITENKGETAQYFSDLSRIRLYEIPINDVWTRDYGPITIYKENQPLLLNFKFNAWGEKYAMPLDGFVCEKLEMLGAFHARREKRELILEGGSIESDGAGTLLTTARCLLNSNRNDVRPNHLEQQLKNDLGLNRIIWLNHGLLCGDDTDAHIDTLARFCSPKQICYQSCDDENDEHFSELQKMAAELKTLTMTNGEPYHLIPLPWPKAKWSQVTGERLPASYANFLITNKKVLVPQYNDAKDQLALNILAATFSDRKIVGINALPIIEGFGSIHCVTMQIPEGAVL